MTSTAVLSPITSSEAKETWCGKDWESVVHISVGCGSCMLLYNQDEQSIKWRFVCQDETPDGNGYTGQEAGTGTYKDMLPTFVTWATHYIQ